MLTQAELKEVLEYDPETGIFRWKIPKSPRVKAGDIAGTITGEGYVRIKFDGKHFQAHRLAWLYVYGVFPKNVIDHINGNPSDNRLSNLRDVTNQENLHNQKPPKNKQSGLPLGVSRKKDGRKKPYQAQLWVDGKFVLNSYHETLEEAEAAYWGAKAIHHPTSPLISHLI